MMDPGQGGQDGVMLAATTVDSEPKRAAPLTRDLAPSFRETFDEHHAFVWRSLMHMGVSASAVDDCVQEVFLVVHRRLSDYDPTQPIRAWLWGVARGVASNHRRTLGRDARRRDALSHGTPNTVPAAADRAIELAFVREILLAMEEPMRDVLVLSDVEGLTAPEISVALDLNQNTVYSRLRTARAKFAEAARKAGHVAGGSDGR